MIQTIRSKDRYHHETDWLSTNWHFSFDHYHDPKNMNFGPLRVFNDDTVAPAGGFPLHSHREMEIVTYVIDGALEHKDNMGNTGVIRPGEIQRMSAGTGIRHSEFNPSEKDPVHLIQLWIMPAVTASAAVVGAKEFFPVRPEREAAADRRARRQEREHQFDDRADSPGRDDLYVSSRARPIGHAQTRAGPPGLHFRDQRKLAAQRRDTRRGRPGARLQRTRVATLRSVRFRRDASGFPASRSSMN